MLNIYSNARENLIRLFHFTGGVWDDITNSGYPDTVNNIICGTTSSFSPFIIAQEASTTVTLSALSARMENNQAALTWSTSSETNNEGFVVVVRLSGPFWEAYAGPISNNSAVITTLLTSDFFYSVNVSVTLSFTSTTSGKVRINFCSPVQDCLFPSGTVFQIEKIF